MSLTSFPVSFEQTAAIFSGSWIVTECQKLNLLLKGEGKESFMGIDLQIVRITITEALWMEKAVLLCLKMKSVRRILELTMKQNNVCLHLTES